VAPESADQIAGPGDRCEIIPEMWGPDDSTLYDMGDLGLCWLVAEEEASNG
jgi:hypothetical protein